MAALPQPALFYLTFAYAVAIVGPMSIPPWCDPFWSNWALVLVGALASGAAIRTLKIIRAQTGHIEQQVKEMQASSKQTDRLIEQAAQQSSAAKEAATAAFTNAQAVINSERAWVMVQIEWQVPSLKGPMTTTTGFRNGEQVFEAHALIQVRCTNEGKSIAWIDEKRICFQVVEELPKQPNFDLLEILDVEPEWLAPKGDGRWLSCTLAAASKDDVQNPVNLSLPIIWGVVKYRDVFGQGQHHAVFGYRITPDRRFERIAGLPDYNKNT